MPTKETISKPLFTRPSWNLVKLINGDQAPPLIGRLLAGSLLSLVVVVAINKMQLAGAFLIIGGVIAVPLVLSALWNTQIGIYLMVLASFFLSVVLRLFPQVPSGLALDFMVLIMLSGRIYKVQFDRNWKSFRSPLTPILLVWIAYHLLQLANPYAASRTAWFYVVRPAVGYLLLYFLVWQSVHSAKSASRLLNFIVLLGAVAGLWGIYQAFRGYFGWEMSHIIRTDTIHLVFINGRWRSMGPTGSPAQYGIIMAVMCCLCTNMSLGSRKWPARAIYLTVAGICLMGMIYSGTRAAFIILPIYYFTKVLISRKAGLWSTLIVAVIALLVLAKMPTNNYHLMRIQSVFNASEDKSYQIRANNRKMITPWIIKHPVGGGLGSTGVWGQRFSPGTFLANFPPDSGIMRVAVELGWIGLIIFLFIYICAFYKGVRAYWNMPPGRSRTQVASILCMLPPLGVAEIGQEVAGVFPMSLLFWILLGLLFALVRVEKSPADPNHSSKINCHEYQKDIRHCTHI